MSSLQTITCPACFHDACQDPNPDEALCPVHAAAHDLLAALESITADCREVLEGREPLTIELIHAIANGKARAAIAKAKGGVR